MNRTPNKIQGTGAAARATASARPRIVAVLSVLGGMGLLTAIALLFGVALANPTMTWASLWSAPVLGVVMLVGGLGGLLMLSGALAGLGLVIGERTNPGMAIVASLGAIGGCLGALGSSVPLVALPAASAIVALYLARLDRLPNRIAVLHAAAGLGSIVVGALWSQNASLGWGDLFILLYPISWVAIGLALVRGVPAIPSPASLPV
jgi:hypothetical protein